MSFTQLVSLQDRDPQWNTGLGLNVGLRLPERLINHIVLTPIYIGVAADALIGARDDRDIAFSSAEIGAQVVSRATVMGTSGVLRAGLGFRNTAETQNGQVLTNLSGKGYTFTAGLRRQIGSIGCIEPSATFITGTFKNAQEEDLDALTHIDNIPVARSYHVIRLSLAFAF